MLVLARKTGQSIVINDNVEVLVIEVRGDQVRLGIEAPRSIPVHRKELLEQIRAENVQAAIGSDLDTVSKAINKLSLD
ncbi:MAG: carbon storage regulator CsrA [Armatimonadota bacterium]